MIIHKNYLLLTEPSYFYVRLGDQRCQELRANGHLDHVRTGLSLHLLEGHLGQDNPCDATSMSLMEFSAFTSKQGEAIETIQI